MFCHVLVAGHWIVTFFFFNVTVNFYRVNTKKLITRTHSSVSHDFFYSIQFFLFCIYIFYYHKNWIVYRATGINLVIIIFISMKLVQINRSSSYFAGNVGSLDAHVGQSTTVSGNQASSHTKRVTQLSPNYSHFLHFTSQFFFFSYF